MRICLYNALRSDCFGMKDLEVAGFVFCGAQRLKNHQAGLVANR